MQIDRRVVAGDVIVGPTFEAARRSEKGTVLVGEPQSEVGEDAADPSRPDAMFLVLKSFWHGEGEARTWRAYARRLTEEGAYDPEGELILFQNGGTAPFQAYVYIVGRVDMSDLDKEQEAAPQDASVKKTRLLLVCKTCGLKNDVDPSIPNLADLKEACPVCVSTIGSNAPMSLVRVKI